MITQTQLEAIGYQYMATDQDDLDFFLSNNGKGNVAIYISEKNGQQIIDFAIYQDCIDPEGYYASEPVYEFSKQNPTIQQIQEFTRFIDEP